MATAVAAAMVAIGAHTFSDAAVGGAAVGVGVVLACALTLDALGSLLRPEPAGATSSCRATSGGAPGRIPGPAAAAHAVVTSGSRPPCPPSSRCPWSVTTTIVHSSAGPDGRARNRRHQPPDPLISGQQGRPVDGSGAGGVAREVTAPR